MSSNTHEIFARKAAIAHIDGARRDPRRVPRPTYKPERGERVRHIERGTLGTVKSLWLKYADIQWEGRTDVLPCDYERLQSADAPIVEKRSSPPKQRRVKASLEPHTPRVKREPKAPREPGTAVARWNRTAEDTRNLVLDGYRSGLGQRALSRQTGVARSTIAELIRQAGIHAPFNATVLTQEQMADMRQKRATGRTYPSLAKEYGVSLATVWRYIAGVRGQSQGAAA